MDEEMYKKLLAEGGGDDDDDGKYFITLITYSARINSSLLRDATTLT